MRWHNYEEEPTDKLIEQTSTLNVFADTELDIVTISDCHSLNCDGYIHLHKGEAIATARAILKHFGEGLE
jgi:hypothetical protein